MTCGPPDGRLAAWLPGKGRLRGERSQTSFQMHQILGDRGTFRSQVACALETWDRRLRENSSERRDLSFQGPRLPEIPSL